MSSGFFTVPRLALGVGAIEQLPALGIRRALIVSDPNPELSVPRQRIIEELAKGGASTELFDRWAPPPSESAVTEGVGRARQVSPDWILALGGGSTIDLARALWIAYACPDLPLEGIGPLTELPLRQRARFIAIPTTSGSGQDAGWTISVERSGGPPVDLSNRELLADWSLVDPTLARTLSPDQRVDGAVQVLANGLESLASEWASPFTNALAREAIATGAGALPKLRRRPEEDLRELLHFNATGAGSAVANAHSGLAAAMARVFARHSARPYAPLLGTLLPYVAEFNFPAARERYQSLSGVLGPSAVQNRGSLGEKLRALLSSAGVASRLPGLGLDTGSGATAPTGWATEVARSPSAIANPRLASPEELLRVYRCAEDGSPVNF